MCLWCCWRMWLHAGNKTTRKQGLFTGIAKDLQIAKARSLGIKCVSVVDINFDSFSSAKLYWQQIWRPCVVMENDLQISREIWAAKVHTSDETNWLNLSYGFRGEIKKFVVIVLLAIPLLLVLQHEPAHRLLTYLRIPSRNSLFYQSWIVSTVKFKSYLELLFQIFL